MRLPSGLTSTFIHVPSDVSNASFVVGPRSAPTSHFFSCACGSGGCLLRGGRRKLQRRDGHNHGEATPTESSFISRASRRREFGLVVDGTAPALSRLRQRYQQAIDR